MKVSIIIPYKTDRGWLQEAIDSTSLQGCELILSQGNANWPTNFNKGLQQATGEYIKWLHDDDVLDPMCVQNSLKCFEETKADFIHGNAIEFKQETGKQLLYKPKITNPTFEQLIQKNVLFSSTMMYHRSVFEKVGLMNESDKMYSFEEFEFNLRCLKAGLKIGYCDSVLAYYRRHKNQIIRTCNIQERKKNRRALINSYQ